MNLYKLCACLGLLTISFASQAKYNEAMCILLKQQMNQYSDSKSNRNYRNAARDYKNNCNKPEPVAVKADDVLEKASPTKLLAPEPIEPVITEPVIEPVSEAKKQVADEVVQPKEIPNTQQIEVINEQKNAPDNTTAAPKSVQSNTASTANLPNETVKIKKPTTAPIKHDAANNQQSSFLMPSLLLLLTLLFAIAILSRLRKKNKAANKDEINDVVLQHQAQQLAKKATAQQEVVDEPKSRISEPVAITKSVQEPEAKRSKDNSTTNDETEIDYPVFEPQALAQQPQEGGVEEPKVAENISTSTESSRTYQPSNHQFDEPEIRTYDPDAPLPGQQEYLQSSSVKENLTKAQSDVVTDGYTTDSFNDVEPFDEHEVEPAKSAPQESEPVEPESSEKSTGSSNPFANLSLDPSWDPNNEQQPTIVEPKAEPKSQALIDAEKRAKQLKTDD